MSRVSVVIPTFNQAAYLPACVDHCLFQTYPEIEIIIVDGGSTDGTKDYLAGLEGEIANTRCTPVTEMSPAGEVVRRSIRTYPQHRRIDTVVFDRDIGPTRTINEGLARATGEFCTYVVGDDLPYPHMIERLVSALERTGADFAYADMNLVNDAGRIVRQMRLPDYAFDRCLARWYHMGVARLYRRGWHDTVGLMDDAYQSANDYDHYLRFAMAGARFVHVPEILYAVRHHGEDRKTGQHSTARYARLLDESSRCAHRAREWLQSGKGRIDGQNR